MFDWDVAWSHRMFRIIKYREDYQDELFYCYLLAKEALGDPLRLRDDLFDIQKYYFDKGDMFWIAVGDHHRVIGMMGTATVSNTDLWLKRLFIKPEMKRKGIACALLNVAINYAKSKRLVWIHTRFNDDYVEASHFYLSQGFIESERSDGHRHFIKRISFRRRILKMSKIAVIGAGSWGTALAQVLADNDNDVMVYDIEESVINDINENHKNSKFFSDASLPKNLKATTDLAVALKGVHFALVVVPTKVMRDALTRMKEFLLPSTVIINASKGIEPKTHKRVSEIVAQVLGEQVTFVALSGPSHAEEVVIREITSVTCAGNDLEVLFDVQQLFSNEYFRVYRTTDLIGVEIGGSIKNVMALGAGILAGLGYGDNARAMLITRSLIEIKRLGVALGAKEETFDGLSGLGDLIVTTMSRHSRNFQAGFLIGSGSDLNEALDSMTMVVEGIRSCQATYELAKKLEIDMPFVDAIYDVVFNRNDPKNVIAKMMQRPMKAENSKRN